MMKQRFDDKYPYKVMRFWPIIISIVLLLITFGAIKRELAYTAVELDCNKEWHHEIEAKVAKLEEAINQLPEIRQDIKSILREMRK